MAKYDRDDILETALHTFPDGILTSYGFAAAPEDDVFVKVMSDRGTMFKEIYDHFMRGAQDEYRRPKQIRDHMFKVQKAEMSELEELTLAITLGEYSLFSLEIRTEGPVFDIKDTAYMVYKACENQQRMQKFSVVAEKILFMKFIQGEKVKYVLRKYHDTQITDFCFEPKKEDSGTFCIVKYGTPGIIGYDLISNRTDLANMISQAEIIKRETRSRFHSGEHLTNPVQMQIVHTGFVAKIMKEQIMQID
jgi:hypothetical protein